VNGLAVTAAVGNIVHSKALKAGAAGAFIEVHWVDAYVK
jgi:hypothetical protein